MNFLPTHQPDPRTYGQAVLAHTIRRTLQGVLVIAIFLATSWALSTLGLGGSILVTDHGTVTPSQVQPVETTTAATLIEAHGCWTGEAPNSELPGHAVVTTADGETVYGGQHLTHMALEQALGIKDHAITVHAFCR